MSVRRGLTAVGLLVLALVVCGSDFAPPATASEARAALPFFYDLFTFRGTGSQTDVVAAIAVPAGGLRRENIDNQTRYRFDVRFVLADTVRRTVFRSDDSVFVMLRRPLDTEHLLHTYVEVQATPSVAVWQRVIVFDATRPGVGQLYHSSFPIPDYSGTGLMLSDIAFGLPGATEGWRRRGVTLALLPTSQFPESSFDVYYEIYNMPTGTPYQTELAIESLDRSNDEDAIVRTLFSSESTAGSDGTVGELRRVESALPKGHYRLTITVRDQMNGRTASRSRLVEVSGWERGETLVPALPLGRDSAEGA
jgi:hypothetical protein